MILQITFGEGGDDSKNFVNELSDAYKRYAQNLSFRVETIHEDYGSISLKIEGKSVYRSFMHENGKHCVQRIPQTESKDRKQTSIVSVGVMPIKRHSGSEELRDEDLEIKFQCGKQGAGGQNVNRVHSACRAKHIPTGLTVFINGRDQGQNKKEAISILTSRVNEMMREKNDAEYASFRKNQVGDGGRSDKTRTYNFLENRVTDHRLGKKTGNIKAIMKGEFGLLLN